MNNLLEITNLKKFYHNKHKEINALEGLSIEVKE